MSVASGQKYIYKYVNLSTGEISREIFVNEEIYQQSWSRSSPGPGCSSATKARS